MLMNTEILVSGVDFFDDSRAINPFMKRGPALNVETARAEHQRIQQALRESGVEVVTVPPPHNCQDGVYTANWGLVRGDKAVLSTLPPGREDEMPYAETTLKDLGLHTYKVPNGTHFSGQGDALPCGNYLFIGTGYRTEKPAHDFIASTLGYEVIGLQAIPQRRFFGLGKPVINKHSGWPDSFFYDIDLALAVLRFPTNARKGLIAWCPEAFVPESRKRLAAFDGVDKVEVSLAEAKNGFAC